MAHPEGPPGDGDEGSAPVVVAEQERVEGGGHQYHLRARVMVEVRVRLEIEGQRLSLAAQG